MASIVARSQRINTHGPILRIERGRLRISLALADGGDRGSPRHSVLKHNGDTAVPFSRRNADFLSVAFLLLATGGNGICARRVIGSKGRSLLTWEPFLKIPPTGNDSLKIVHVQIGPSTATTTAYPIEARPTIPDRYMIIPVTDETHQGHE